MTDSIFLRHTGQGWSRAFIWLEHSEQHATWLHGCNNASFGRSIHTEKEWTPVFQTKRSQLTDTQFRINRVVVIINSSSSSRRRHTNTHIRMIVRRNIVRRRNRNRSSVCRSIVSLQRAKKNKNKKHSMKPDNRFIRRRMSRQSFRLCIQRRMLRKRLFARKKIRQARTQRQQKTNKPRSSHWAIRPKYYWQDSRQTNTGNNIFQSRPHSVFVFCPTKFWDECNKLKIILPPCVAWQWPCQESEPETPQEQKQENREEREHEEANCNSHLRFFFVLKQNQQSKSTKPTFECDGKRSRQIHNRMRLSRSNLLELHHNAKKKRKNENNAKTRTTNSTIHKERSAKFAEFVSSLV